MPAILHITSRDGWDAATLAGNYRGDTLATEGFIHCSTPAQVVSVANARFAGRTDLVLLRIDPARLNSDLRWEMSEPGEAFPHIYGPLNLDAVIEVLPFPPNPDGTFALPAVLADQP